ncbi:hypothetical protein BJX76DRAFT_361454 [Aspergillus varians]
MDPDTKIPQAPPQAHPAAPSTYDYEAQQGLPATKNKLKTWGDVQQEWRHGSKSRVLKYYIAYILIGFIIGAVVGVLVGVVTNSYFAVSRL